MTGPKLIQVELSKIIIDEKRQDQIIVLKEKGGDRQFPIVIGVLEASSIKMKLAGAEPPRPLTHDLCAAIVKELGAKVDRLVIDKLIENTFHAKLEIKGKGAKTIQVDTRPSDGVAIAVRTNADIYVTDEVINKAAILNTN